MGVLDELDLPDEAPAPDKGKSVLDEIDLSGDDEAEGADEEGMEESLGQEALDAFKSNDPKAMYEVIAKIAAHGGM